MSGLEKRTKVRVSFNTEIILRTDGSEIRSVGNSRDLSLNGVFLNTDVVLAPGTKCRVEVVLTGSTDNVELLMDGAVVRCEEDGMAISFEKMGLDTYTHLKNVVRYNTDDPDEVF